jgi:hypothetical protein
MATEKALEDLRVAVTIQMDLGIAVPAEQHEPVTPAHGQLDEFQGRLALRLGTTHGVTRSFTLARASVSEANLALTAAASESSPDGEAAEASREERAREYLEAADAAQRDIRTHRIEFFDRARQLVGVEDAPRDAAEQAALAKGATAAARDAA